jgi:hypothetical protein
VGIVTRAALSRVLDVSRHAQMDEEVAPALELDYQILPAAPHRPDALALELGGHCLGWLGPRQTRISDEHALEGAPGQAGLQTGADRLDFR